MQCPVHHMHNGGRGAGSYHGNKVSSLKDHVSAEIVRRLTTIRYTGMFK